MKTHLIKIETDEDVSIIVERITGTIANQHDNPTKIEVIEDIAQMKYYWYSALYSTYGNKFKPMSGGIIETHPITFISNLRSNFEDEGYEIVLLGWQEITKEEYDLIPVK